MTLLHVHHHSTLQSRGGTARVAHGLLNYLSARDISASHSYEMQDSEPAGLCLAPENLAHKSAHPVLPTVTHLHGSEDWLACLNPFSKNSTSKLLITLHDCRLLTGGCAYPLDCRQWETGCRNSCPQNIAETAVRWRCLSDLIRKLRPMFIAPSAWLTRMVRSLHPDAQIQIIPNGIAATNDKPFSKAEQKRKLGIHPASRVVLFVAHGGKLAMYKGGHLWAAIWRQIKKNNPHAVALAVGGDEVRRSGDYLEMPYLDQNHLLQCMDAADVFVYPALADNHPLIILEAMSRCLPCTAFATGGIPEQIIHNQSGLLVTRNDVQGLSAMAVQILQNPGLGRHLAINARQRFEKLFSLELSGEQHLRLYRQLLRN